MTATVLLVGGLLALPVLVFIASFLFWPGKLLKLYNWYWRRRLGLVVRYSHCGSYRFCYSSRGTPNQGLPSLLLLHGFSASKDMWLPLIDHLPKELHVLCVDMPGHDGTSRTGPEDYSIQGQVNRIHQFVCSVGLDRRPFHLAGSSMGGNVAGVYAATFRSDLSGVTLVCPAGLLYPTDSWFIRRLKELENSRTGDESIPLIPTTLPEMENMLNLLCHKPPNAPRQILRGILANRIPNNKFYKEVFTEIVGPESRYSLQDHLHEISVPTQVIWGTEDKVLDVSGAAVIQEAVPHCQVDLLETCGHSVNMERPRKLAKLLLDFLSAQKVGDPASKKLC